MNDYMRLFACGCVGIALALAGCGNESGANGSHAHPATEGDHDDHDHEHGEHSEHDDAEGQGHEETRSVGAVEIAGSTLGVTVSGKLAPNAEVQVEIALTGGATPAAVRMWIGEESGVGSLRSKADGHDDHFHGHVVAPASLSDNAALWVEVETASGERSAKPLPLD